MIKKELVGSRFSVYYNSMQHTGTISEDPSKWDYYRTLGLDVFEVTEREKIIEQLEAQGIKYHSNSRLETLKKKLDGNSNESNDEHGTDFHVDGEDHD